MGRENNEGSNYGEKSGGEKEEDGGSCEGEKKWRRKRQRTTRLST